VTGQVQVPNARCAADLGGVFGATTTTSGPGPFVVTSGAFGGAGTNQQPVGGIQVGAGIGTPGTETTYGGTQAWTKNFVGSGCAHVGQNGK
jgi:hypothetical protein